MSRRTLFTDDYQIVAGWDRILREHFFSVVNEDHEREVDSLEDANLCLIENIATEIKKWVPDAHAAVRDQFVEDLREDQRANVGNLFVEYDLSGTTVTEDQVNGYA
jgi:hypothetical protein